MSHVVLWRQVRSKCEVCMAAGWTNGETRALIGVCMERS